MSPLWGLLIECKTKIFHPQRHQHPTMPKPQTSKQMSVQWCMRPALCSDRSMDSSLNFLRVICGNQYWAQLEKFCLIHWEVMSRACESGKWDWAVGSGGSEASLVCNANNVRWPVANRWTAQDLQRPRILFCWYGIVHGSLTQVLNFTKPSFPPNSPL